MPLSNAKPQDSLCTNADILGLVAISRVSIRSTNSSSDRFVNTQNLAVKVMSHQEYGYLHSHSSLSYFLAVGGNTPFKRRYIAVSA